MDSAPSAKSRRLSWRQRSPRDLSRFWVVSPLGGQPCHSSRELFCLPWRKVGAGLLLGLWAKLTFELWKWTLTSKGQCTQISMCWRVTKYITIKNRAMQVSSIVIAINTSWAPPMMKQDTDAAIILCKKRTSLFNACSYLPVAHINWQKLLHLIWLYCSRLYFKKCVCVQVYVCVYKWMCSSIYVAIRGQPRVTGLAFHHVWDRASCYLLLCVYSGLLSCLCFPFHCRNSGITGLQTTSHLIHFLRPELRRPGLCSKRLFRVIFSTHACIVFHKYFTFNTALS